MTRAAPRRVFVSCYKWGEWMQVRMRENKAYIHGFQQRCELLFLLLVGDFLRFELGYLGAHVVSVRGHSFDTQGSGEDVSIRKLYPIANEVLHFLAAIVIQGFLLALERCSTRRGLLLLPLSRCAVSHMQLHLPHGTYSEGPRKYCAGRL